jgi:putative peptidoglycan lipid II flippase
VRHTGVDLRIAGFLRSRFVIHVLGFAAPLLIAQSVLQVNPIVDRTMAAALRTSSVTVLDLAVGMSSVPVALVASSLIGPIAATWASRYAEAGWPALRNSYARAARGLLFAVPPLVVLGFLLRRQLVIVTYEWGAFTSGAASRTALCFGMFLLGLPAQAFVVLLSTLFVIRGDSRLPMKIAFANVGLNLALNFPLRHLFGVAGLALSTTLTYSILCGIYVSAARHRFGPLGAFRREDLTPALIASGIVALTVASFLRFLPVATTKANALLEIFAVLGLALVVYLAALTTVAKDSLADVAARLWRLRSIGRNN